MNTYLSRNYAPVREEVTVTDLRVSGTLPSELNGRYVRNGPNPVADPEPANHHWFLGDGMVHGVCLRDGKAAWYRNRFVASDTIARELAQPISGSNWSGSAHGPNTNVAGHAGRTWAVMEGGATPVELTYDLDSVARNDFFGTLPGAFTGHPKLDATTGELHAMVYAPEKWFDHVQYVVVGRDGRVRRTVDVPLGMSMLHDMSLTEKYAIVYDLPVTVDVDLALSGVGFPFRWNPEYGARVGLLPREGEAADMVWIEVPLCYAYHPMNAYDSDDGTVVIDICTYDRMFVHDVNGPFGDAAPRLERWTLTPANRRSSVTTIDTTPQEFPRHAPAVGNRPYRYGYSVAIGADPAGPTLKHDLLTGRRTSYDYGPGRGAGEPVFVPRESADAEDDGWLLAFTHHFDGSAATFVVLDAQDIERGPVAEITLPQRVPYGFHGNWISDQSVAPPAHTT